MVSMNDIFLMMNEKEASDLHLTVGAPPVFRIHGILSPSPFERLTGESCQKLIYSLLSDSQRQTFESANELDIAFGLKGLGRLRMNVYRQRGYPGASIRAIPSNFKSFEELNLPHTVYDLMKVQKGLVLITGPTGSGKSTSLASMIDYLNENMSGHIVTIEDPIEYVHNHKKCLINQREVGSDTETFSAALKHVLRQDPDIILVGEMRDLETISTALMIAETGHLVFATLHTTDAAQSINRIVDVFPPYQQSQIRVQLSFVLQAVFSQQLVTRADGVGRVLACEVLKVNAAIRSLIRDMKIEQIQMVMQTGQKYGMQTMNMALLDLYKQGQITYQEAMARTLDREDLKKLMQRVMPVPGRT